MDGGERSEFDASFISDFAMILCDKDDGRLKQFIPKEAATFILPVCRQIETMGKDRGNDSAPNPSVRVVSFNLKFNCFDNPTGL